MNKVVLFSVAALLAFASCSKKTHPAVSKTGKDPEKTAPSTSKNKDPEKVFDETLPGNSGLAPAAAGAAFDAPLIVIDEGGKVVTPADKLPADLAGKVDYKRISKGFTLEQRKNIIYRFKMVPPKVLFVPEGMSSKSARGTYVIYKKKFYYWRKDDGLFHLDETYYQ